MNFDCGVSISYVTSFDTLNPNMPHMLLYGTKGNLTCPDPNRFGADKGMLFQSAETGETTELPLVFDYAHNSRCLGLADLCAAIEKGRPPRTSYLQTLHVLEIMMGIMKSSETGLPYEMTTHFEREAPMDPTLPHGVL